MKRVLTIAAFLASSLLAQVQLSIFDGTNERPVAPLNEIGAVAVGDSREIRFRVRNTGSAAVNLQMPSVAGQGFTISNAPSMPYVIAPDNFAEFRVRFTPTGPGAYSATVTANGIQTFLRATAFASANVSVQGQNGLLTSGATVNFGRIQKGRSTTLEFRVSNASSAPVTIESIAVSGGAFRKAAGPQGPAMLGPGESLTFSIAFEPPAASVYTGSLIIDSRQFKLSGAGFDPPFPSMIITAPDSAASGQQQTFTLRFAAAPEASGTGTVVMEFHPASGLADDPAIRFVSPGGRKASFRVSEGDAVASFDGLKELIFQTGTTAGEISFTVTLGEMVERKTVAIAPAAISVDHANAVRRVNDIDVSVTGYNNTRTAGPLAFTFFDTSGRVVGGGAIRFDASSQFRQYFSESQVGGAFLFRATFPVTGDASQIGSVEVELANSAGVTVPTKIPIP